MQLSLPISTNQRLSSTLSWGSDEELLVGSESLRLHQTAEDGCVIWNRKLAKPVKIATFSFDSGLVASTGWHDRLVKLWRRQSFGSDDTRFDFTYLSHPATVTALRWRKHSFHEHHQLERNVEDVLFSISVDGKIRIWATTDQHAAQGLQFWAEIDMQQSIQSRKLGEGQISNERYAFFIDSPDFATAADKILEVSADSQGVEVQAHEHLKEVAKTKPDVCVVLDRQGNMSAWGLENVGCKVRKSTDVFNIAHVENFGLAVLQDGAHIVDHIQFLSFCNDASSTPLTLLTHHFDGRIIWYESSLEELFNPLPCNSRIRAKALWTGHDGLVKKIVRNGSGNVLMSRTNDNEGLVWKQDSKKGSMLLTRQSSLSCTEHIHRLCILEEADFIVTLHLNKLSLWDTKPQTAREVASCIFESKEKLLCLLLLPATSLQQQTQYVAAITSRMSGRVWKLSLHSDNHPKSLANGNSAPPRVTEFCRFDVRVEDEMDFVLPVDPAGLSVVSTGFLDTFAKDLAVSYTKSGVLYGWSASLDLDRKLVNWLVTSTVSTNMHNPSLASSSSTRKVALVDAAKTTLAIWDMQSAQLEFDTTYGLQATIQDLDWSSTPDQQSILAVGFPYRVILFAQMRYDYITTGLAWAPVRELRIKELTSHPIGDSVWLGSGNLVVGAGNQLYAYDEEVSMSDDLVISLEIPVHKYTRPNLFWLVSYLNGPLPLYHPQFLSQCILNGMSNEVQGIILALYQSLKYFVAGDELDSYLSLPIEGFLARTDAIGANLTLTDAYDDGPLETFTAELAASLNDTLTKLALPDLTSPQQIRLASIIECVATAEKHKRSMDGNAMRYNIFFSQHILLKHQSPADRSDITWRDMVWAFHSNSQDILVDLVSRQASGRMCWENARECGIFMWMTDMTALVGSSSCIFSDINAYSI